MGQVWVKVPKGRKKEEWWYGGCAWLGERVKFTLRWAPSRRSISSKSRTGARVGANLSAGRNRCVPSRLSRFQMPKQQKRISREKERATSKLS